MTSLLLLSFLCGLRELISSDHTHVTPTSIDMILVTTPLSFITIGVIVVVTKNDYNFLANLA